LINPFYDRPSLYAGYLRNVNSKNSIPKEKNIPDYDTHKYNILKKMCR
jgi:hypothetical protein